MVHSFRLSILPVAVLAVGLTGAGFVAFSGGDPIPGTEEVKVGTPARTGSLPFIGGTPTLTSGFQDWPLCELGDRVETRPPLLGLYRWGPATLAGLGGGCSPCGGGGAGYAGDPFSAALGLQLAPPHDIPMGDAGQLPPSPKDHPFVMAGTGEVVYTEVDFVIPGIGFDLIWARTYRSAYEFEGFCGYGWSHSAELYLVEADATTGDVQAFFGNGRVNDLYDWTGTIYVSPDGYWDQLSKGTRPSNYTPSNYATQPYFTRTEKNGVTWEFDNIHTTQGKRVYGCTKIADPFGNEMLLAYSDADGDGKVFELTSLTDTEGREVTFTYTSDLLTQVTVSNSSTHTDYGNVTIDYEYSGDLLVEATKHKTRQADGGTVVRPYTEYTYLSSGIYAKDLDLVKDCGTTVLDFDYSAYGGTRDRCTKVTNADGEEHEYLHEQGSSPTYVRYTDPSDQQRDFVHTDSANGDYFIAKVKEYLEDEDGADLSGSYDLTITRDCDCGQITELEYPDGSAEQWDYDDDGNILTYTRTASDSSPNLVKAWTYDTFGSHSRVLTSSGWLRAETSPSAKVTWTWSSTTGLLEKVAWPAVTTGQQSSQTIEWEYTFYSDGKLKEVFDPEDNETEYSYSGDTITISTDPGALARVQTVQRDLMGNVIYTENAIGTEDTFTVAPDGRVLKVASSNSRERKYEYDLRGRRTKYSLLLDDAGTWTHTTYTVSAGGVVTQTKEDDGGINAINAFAIEEGESNRYTQSLDADSYGTRSKWGYGSYGLPWKAYNVDATGTPVVTLIETLERNTMGRITSRVDEGGRTITYVYDGYGRLIETHEPLPSSKTRKTVLTLKDWGAVEVSEVKESTTLLAKSTNYYDEAVRLWKVERDDPTSTLSDLVTTYRRDKNGRVALMTDPRGENWTTEWDAAGRLKKSVDPIGNEVQHAYNDASRTHTITSKEWNTSTSSSTDYVIVETMDASGRVTSSKDQGSASGNRTTSFTFDRGGRVKNVTTPNGAETDYTYDNLGRVVTVTQEIDGSNDAVTTYSVSDAGRVVTATDDNGVVTEWTYDYYGRITSVTYDSGGTEATYMYGYDDGRLETITEPLGNYVTLTYDDGGRVKWIDVSKASSGLGGPDRYEYTYTELDQVSTAKTQQYSGGYSDLTSVTRTYDGFGRLDTETQDGGFAVSYDYDAGSAISKIDYPSGSPIDYLEYLMDDAGRLVTVKRLLTSAVEGYSSSVQTCAEIKYHGQREIQRVQSPYGLKRTQTWTTFKEPADLKYEEDGTTNLLTGLSSMWNADSQMVVRERLHDDAGGYDYGEVFRYDLLGRLTTMWYDVRNPSGFSVTDPVEGTNPYDHKKLYLLGGVYERDKVTVDPYSSAAVDVEYSNNAFYQYDPIDGVNLDWDSNGQLTDYGSDSFSWTALGQLSQAAISGLTARDYTYDAFGRRVKTVVGSQVNRFLYHGWHMIGEYDDTTDEWLWQEVPWHAGERMLEHIALDETMYKQYAVHEDFQSTVWGLSNTSAALVERYNYTDPFGVSDSEDGSGTPLGTYASDWHHRKRLHGGFVEEVSGLYDFRMRWNDPEGGYWLSRDPMGVVDSFNLQQTFLHGPQHYQDQFGMRAGGPGSTWIPDGEGYRIPPEADPPIELPVLDPCQNAMRRWVDNVDKCDQQHKEAMSDRIAIKRMGEGIGKGASVAKGMVKDLPIPTGWKKGITVAGAAIGMLDAMASQAGDAYKQRRDCMHQACFGELMNDLYNYCGVVTANKAATDCTRRGVNHRGFLWISAPR